MEMVLYTIVTVLQFGIGFIGVILMSMFAVKFVLQHQLLKAGVLIGLVILAEFVNNVIKLTTFGSIIFYFCLLLVFMLIISSDLKVLDVKSMNKNFLSAFGYLEDKHNSNKEK